MSGRSVANALALPRGVTCLVGGGGKTTLAHVLAAQLPGSVIFCTTTRIFPSETLPVVTGSVSDGKIQIGRAHV